MAVLGPGGCTKLDSIRMPGILEPERGFDPRFSDHAGASAARGVGAGVSAGIDTDTRPQAGDVTIKARLARCPPIAQYLQPAARSPRFVARVFRLNPTEGHRRRLAKAGYFAITPDGRRAKPT
jgi:hypothetical protein